MVEEERNSPQPALLDRAMEELARLKEKYFFKNEAQDQAAGTSNEEREAAKKVIFDRSAPH